MQLKYFRVGAGQFFAAVCRHIQESNTWKKKDTIIKTETRKIKKSRDNVYHIGEKIDHWKTIYNRFAYNW